MYGLLLESIYGALKSKYGEKTFNDIRLVAGIEKQEFLPHECYSEKVIPMLASAVCDVTMTPYSDVMEYFGAFFVNYISRFGYDTILRTLGRNMRDFLNGLDNLHQYLRLSYPKMRAPSFFCEDETREGLTLHYRSQRRGFTFYVLGQIREVGRMFYRTDIEIEILQEEVYPDMVHVKMRLYFDNTGYLEVKKRRNLLAENYTSENLSMRSSVFFGLFPFHILFNRSMVIKCNGKGLNEVLGSLVNKKVDLLFFLLRPPLPFEFNTIDRYSNNYFELLSLNQVTSRRDSIATNVSSVSQFHESDALIDDSHYYLKLRGMMKYIKELDSYLFLGNPVLESMEHMYDIGLYINDLCMHDVSRDLVMLGTEQSHALKNALFRQRQKSRKLEELTRLLDAEKQRTNSLLYQMIPQEVADRLRRGEPAVNTCEMFEQVSVMFCEVTRFNVICAQISPMQVVSMLNNMYTLFDQLTEKHHVFKVETVGNAYMVVSGAPTKTRHHAVYICEMALDMMEVVQKITDPSTTSEVHGGHIQIKIGMHTGTVVAGIVGLKTPRYCLFGDVVNTASRMETTSESMKIHVSATIKLLLEPYPYIISTRGKIEIKGKGEMQTFWLLGRTEPPEQYVPPYRCLSLPTGGVQASRESSRDASTMSSVCEGVHSQRSQERSGTLTSQEVVPETPEHATRCRLGLFDATGQESKTCVMS